MRIYIMNLLRSFSFVLHVADGTGVIVNAQAVIHPLPHPLHLGHLVSVSSTRTVFLASENSFPRSSPVMSAMAGPCRFGRL